MSKIESGKFDLSLSEFNFEKMLNRIVNVISLQIQKKQINFKVSVDRNIPEILIGDEQRLAQVITNLLGNAIKFTPEEGSISMGAYFLGEKDGVCTLQVAVTDSGIGINKEQQSDLFHPFWQSESNMSRQFEGTGLGLAISKNIVEMMGGKIWVESELGSGAVFTFTIKVKRGVAKNKSFLDTKQRAVPQFAGRHILLAEDVEINREIILALLEPTLLKIDCAENGKEAIVMFSESPEKYDMIFMDLQMPQMNGYEATRNIRALNFPKAKTIPIVAMTANTFKEDVDKCLKAGMNGHIGKPLDYDLLLDQISAFLT